MGEQPRARLQRYLCLQPYLVHVLNAFDYTGRVVGATRSKLNQGRAVDIPIPVPPLTEQHRIVSKVDELMTLCDQLEATRNEREETRDRLAKSSLARVGTPDADPETSRTHARFAADAIPALTARADQVKQLPPDHPQPCRAREAGGTGFGGRASIRTIVPNGKITSSGAVREAQPRVDSRRLWNVCEQARPSSPVRVALGATCPSSPPRERPYPKPETARMVERHDSMDGPCRCKETQQRSHLRDAATHKRCRLGKLRSAFVARRYGVLQQNGLSRLCGHNGTDNGDKPRLRKLDPNLSPFIGMAPTRNDG